MLKGFGHSLCAAAYMEFVIDILEVFLYRINGYKTFIRNHFIRIAFYQQFQYFLFPLGEVK
jgi:hypothetical protein